MSATLRCRWCGRWIAKTDYRNAVIKVNRGAVYQNVEREVTAGRDPVSARRPQTPAFRPEMVQCSCDPVDGTIYMLTDEWRPVGFGEWERFAHTDPPL